MKIKAIIFDLWETLGTKNIGISESLRSKFGIEKTPDFMHLYEHAVQLKKWDSEEEMAENFLKEFHLESTPENIVWIRDLFREGIEKATLFPGILELLQTLKSKGYKLGFISNTTVFESVVLDTWGIRDLFDVISFSWEVGVKKPTKEIFDVTLNKLDVAPEEAVFIDDGQKNIDTVKSFGMHGIKFESVDQLHKELTLLGVL